MIYLILIGGGIVALLGLIITFYITGKSVGRQKERSEIMENEVKSALDTKKRRIAHSNDNSDDVRKRVRKYARD